ncbi:HNH endonuclease signature motif containing protein [Serratia marcescens]
MNGYTYLVHRVCWALSTGEWPTEDVDHINGIKDDNRLVNLRVVTRGVNSRNQKLRSNNSTDCMGVTRDNNSFRVRVGTEGKRVSLGNFKTLDEAVKVRKNAESSYGFHENHGR